MRYKEYKLDVDLEVLSLVETVSGLAIAESHHYGMRPGTVRASLKRLMEAGKVKRRCWMATLCMVATYTMCLPRPTCRQWKSAWH